MGIGLGEGQTFVFVNKEGFIAVCGALRVERAQVAWRIRERAKVHTIDLRFVHLIGLTSRRKLDYGFL